MVNDLRLKATSWYVRWYRDCRKGFEICRRILKFHQKVPRWPVRCGDFEVTPGRAKPSRCKTSTIFTRRPSTSPTSCPQGVSVCIYTNNNNQHGKRISSRRRCRRSSLLRMPTLLERTPGASLIIITIRVGPVLLHFEDTEEVQTHSAKHSTKAVSRRR